MTAIPWIQFSSQHILNIAKPLDWKRSLVSADRLNLDLTQRYLFMEVVDPTTWKKYKLINNPTTATTTISDWEEVTNFNFLERSHIKVQGWAGVSAYLNGIYNLVSVAPLAYAKTEGSFFWAEFIIYDKTTNQYFHYTNWTKLAYHSNVNSNTDITTHSWNVDIANLSPAPSYSYEQINPQNILDITRENNWLVRNNAIIDDIAKPFQQMWFLKPQDIVVGWEDLHCSAGFCNFEFWGKLTDRYIIWDILTFTQNWAGATYNSDINRPFVITKSDFNPTTNKTYVQCMNKDFFPTFIQVDQYDYNVVRFIKKWYNWVVGVYDEMVSCYWQKSAEANRELRTVAWIKEFFNSNIPSTDVDNITIDEIEDNLSTIIGSENVLDDLINNNWQNGIDYDRWFNQWTLLNWKITATDQKGIFNISFIDNLNQSSNKVWDEWYYQFLSDYDTVANWWNFRIFSNTAWSTSANVFHNHWLYKNTWLYRYSVYLSWDAEERRMYSFVSDTGSTSSFYIYLINKSNYPLKLKHSIKNIDYIIDDDDKSIDWSDTPMNDAHTELVTRAKLSKDINDRIWTHIIDIFPVISTIITNWYIDLTHTPNWMSKHFKINWLDEYDYTLNMDRITFWPTIQLQTSSEIQVEYNY